MSDETIDEAIDILRAQQMAWQAQVETDRRKIEEYAKLAQAENDKAEVLRRSTLETKKMNALLLGMIDRVARTEGAVGGLLEEVRMLLLDVAAEREFRQDLARQVEDIRRLLFLILSTSNDRIGEVYKQIEDLKGVLK